MSNRTAILGLIVFGKLIHFSFVQHDLRIEDVHVIRHYHLALAVKWKPSCRQLIGPIQVSYAQTNKVAVACPSFQDFGNPQLPVVCPTFRLFEFVVVDIDVIADGELVVLDCVALRVSHVWKINALNAPRDLNLGTLDPEPT